MSHFAVDALMQSKHKAVLQSPHGVKVGNATPPSVQFRNLRTKKIIQGFSCCDPSDGGTYDEFDREYYLNQRRRYLTWQDVETYTNYDPRPGYETYFGDPIETVNITFTTDYMTGKISVSGNYCAAAGSNPPYWDADIIPDSTWVFADSFIHISRQGFPGQTDSDPDYARWEGNPNIFVLQGLSSTPFPGLKIIGAGGPTFTGTNFYTGVSSLTQIHDSGSHSWNGGSWDIVSNRNDGSPVGAMEDLVTEVVTGDTFADVMGADSNWGFCWGRYWGEGQVPMMADVETYDTSTWTGDLHDWVGVDVSENLAYSLNDGTAQAQRCEFKTNIKAAYAIMGAFLGWNLAGVAGYQQHLITTGVAEAGVPVEIPLPPFEYPTIPADPTVVYYYGYVRWVVFN